MNIYISPNGILIFSINKEEHEYHLEQFVEIIERKGLNISPKKMELRQEKIGFLGQTITPNGIELQDHISKKVLDFKRIKNKKDLQSFLGLVNQARNYIPHLSKLTSKITKLAGETTRWEWNEENEKIIENIKLLCQDLPKLNIPSENENWIIYTDASENYWGAALYHKKEKEELITRYASGKFNESQTKYHSNWKEFLAIIKAVEKFELFIVGTKFVIKTDNTQVKTWLSKGIRNQKLSNKMLIKWQTDMFYYDYDIEIIKGRNNLVADFLSRWKQIAQ